MQNLAKKKTIACEQALVWVLCARCETRVAKPREAGSRLGFMRELRDASGEAARAWGAVGGLTRPPRPTLSRLCSSRSFALPCSSRSFATRVSHLAHKTQTRACSQAKKTTFSQDIPFISMCFNINTSKCAIVPKGKRLFCKILHFFLSQ